VRRYLYHHYLLTIKAKEEEDKEKMRLLHLTSQQKEVYIITRVIFPEQQIFFNSSNSSD
jgi:hypothetical protein